MHDAIFVHIPKTGGKTVRTVFDLLVLNTVDFKISNGRVCFGHAPLNVIKSLSLSSFYKSAFKFTFVRNPLSKTVSAFLFVGKALGYREFNERTFLHFVKTQLHYVDLVTLPQTYFLNNDSVGLAEFDFIGKFENFREDILHLSKIFGIKIDKIPVINNSKYERKWEDFYCDESYQIVQKMYKTDFEVLKYDKLGKD